MEDLFALSRHIRIIYAGLLLGPLMVSSAAALGILCGAIVLPEGWLRMARHGLLGLGLFMFGATFLAEWTFRKPNTMIRARQLDPQKLILQTTLAFAVTPSTGAFFLYLAGGSVTAVYLWACASYVVASFWCIRCRHTC